MINVSEMNHITLTIIIPCYNVESYLPACLACIESQSYKNFRCILVDDGSTDATGAICDELVKKDSPFPGITYSEFWFFCCQEERLGVM